MTKTELNHGMVKEATESKAAQAVLNTSLQFSQAIDVMNKERITEVLKNQKEISNLKVDREQLTSEINRLKEGEDKIRIYGDPFSSQRSVIVDVSDEIVKELIDEAKAEEIKNLKLEVNSSKRAHDASIHRNTIEVNDLRHEINLSSEQHSNELSNARVEFRQQLEKKAQEVKDLKFRYEQDLTKAKERYDQYMVGERSEYQRYKAQYQETLNGLRIEIGLLDERLGRLKRHLKRNWFVKSLSKGINDLIEDLGSIQWTARKEQLA